MPLLPVDASLNGRDLAFLSHVLITGVSVNNVKIPTCVERMKEQVAERPANPLMPVMPPLYLQSTPLWKECHTYYFMYKTVLIYIKYLIIY